jgi:type II secretory pathway pseudopilin PulG
MYFQNRRPDEGPGNAFTFTELLAILSTIALLASIVLPVLARDTDSPERAACLSNMKRIMAAVAMYSTDNNDYLPHPSWGADLAGPDNWCYATRLPSGETAPSAAGKGGLDAHTNQIPFYLAGQLARFLESQRVLVCPTDWRVSMSAKRVNYIQRAQKLSSYTMSGAVGAYALPKSVGLPNGVTYKTTDFLPTDILLSEQSETESFYFNDAAYHPQWFGQVLTRRHREADGEGLGVVGRSGATADFMKWSSLTNLQVYRGQANDLLCGPGYQ